MLRLACIVALSLLVLLVAQHHLNAQEMVLHRFVSRNPDPKIERLLYLAAGVQLVREGISSTRTGKNEDFILLTRYSSARDSVTVHYILLTRDKPDRPLASAKTTIPLNQNLDAAVAKTIRKLLMTAGIKAVPSPMAEIEGVLPAAPGSSAQPNAPIETAKPTLTLPLAPPSEGAARASPQAPNLPSATPTPVPRATPTPRFDSTVSAASVLFFGKITTYIHYGFAGSTTDGIGWRTKKMDFGLAVRLSVVRALDDQGVIGGPLYLSTAGLDLHLGSGSERPYRFSAELSGGAAFLSVVGTQKTQTKTAPYGDIGLNAVVPIGKRLSLGASIRFLTIFDKGLLIMGALPAVTLGSR